MLIKFVLPQAFRRPCFVFVSLFVSLLFLSCSTPNKEKEDEEELRSRSGFKSELMKNLNPLEKGVLETEPIHHEVIRLDDVIEDYGSAFQIIQDRKAVEDVPPERKPFYEAVLSKEDENRQEDIELDLDAASLRDEIIPMFASPEFLNFNYMLDPAFKGTAVSINVKTKMSKREIWQLFEQMLWTGGAYCSYRDGIVYIQPISQMPQDKRVLIQQGPQVNVEVRLFPIKNMKAPNVAAQIKPFLTSGAQAFQLAETNAILVVEIPDNMAKIDALINLLDTRERANWPKDAIYCENVSASEIKKELVNLLPILGFPVTMDKATAEPGSIHLTSVDRLRVIIASAANLEALEELRRWVNILDRDDIGEQERVYVYKVVNNTADDLLKAISAIFKVESTALAAPTQDQAVSKPSATLETKGSQRAQDEKRTEMTKDAPSATGPGGAPGERVISVFETPMKIFADGSHNRLVVRTTPRTYAMLKALLRRLDTIPAQVLLQVMIAEIILEDGASFSLDYMNQQKGSIDGNDVKTIYGIYNSTRPIASTGTTPTGLRPPEPVIPNSGFNYMVFDRDNPDRYFAISALANRGKFKILSSPQIMAVSHTKAQVKVGDRVPIATSQVTSADITSQLKQEIQYYDTGVILYLTPHITKGGRIVIDLDQTVSQARETKTSNINSPTITERKFTTTLSLRNESTIIVGGLISEEKQESKQSLPIVVDIPIVSSLIGGNRTSMKRVELLVLITATIVDERTDLQEQVIRYKNAVKSIETFESRTER